MHATFLAIVVPVEFAPHIGVYRVFSQLPAEVDVLVEPPAVDEAPPSVLGLPPVAGAAVAPPVDALVDGLPPVGALVDGLPPVDVAVDVSVAVVVAAVGAPPVAGVEDSPPVPLLPPAGV